MTTTPENDIAIGSASLAYVEQLYDRWVADPSAVSAEWRAYFEELERKETHAPGQSPRVTIGREQLREETGPGGDRCQRCGRALAMSDVQHRVDELIRAFRTRGHLAAQVDPLERPVPDLPELKLESYGFGPADARLTVAGGALGDGKPLTLAGLVSRLHATYCGHVGAEIAHVDDPAARAWIEERMERTRNRIPLSRERQVRILTRLTEAVTFERFLQTKFVGAKSFSLEGAESLIPLLDLAIEKAGELGVREIALGMSHRGRLNALANVMGKDPRLIFAEFKDADPEAHGGDVKYHLGYHRDVEVAGGAVVHVDLCFNPSHLEFVAPVVLGRLRAKLDRGGGPGLAIVVHGDAAFAGQGIVQETLNLSALPAYSVGGALHVVVNNQIGFTTPPEEARSGRYATDVAKMLGAPILHVNGENPEAVAQAIDLALEYRARFARDVIVDMWCYRLRGHNEGDEPAFTQPVLYAAIRRRAGTQAGYQRHLIALGEIAAAEAGAIAAATRERLEREYAGTGAAAPDAPRSRTLGSIWDRYRGGAAGEPDAPETGADGDLLGALLERIAAVPEGFAPHPKIARFLQARIAMSRGGAPLDWAAGEALALASLALDGLRVRLVGQDSERGTFSQRHAVLHDAATDARLAPLTRLGGDQAPVEIRNSPLSEIAALGFEYGYSLARPDGLVLWEAQFGDFANVAQAVIDEFVAAGERKWGVLSGLALLLPHGLEGTGPDHASARLERFLALSANRNWRVVQPTTPAQIFHVLRRQALSATRVPLVVMAPKSLLRHPRAVSPLADLGPGTRFAELLPDPAADPAAVRRALVCSGKLFYELAAERERRGRGDVAILRLEQLYPLPEAALLEELGRFPGLAEIALVQEEPENMGWLPYAARKLAAPLAARGRVSEIARPESESPAAGSAAAHKAEQAALIARALA